MNHAQRDWDWDWVDRVFSERLGAKEVRDVLGITAGEYWRSRNVLKVLPSTWHIERIAAYFGVTVQELQALSVEELQNLRTSCVDFPEEWLEGAYSRAHVVWDILGSIRMFSWRLYSHLLSRFGLTEEMFFDRSRMVSIRLPAAILSELRRHGATDSKFISMGEFSFDSNRESTLSSVFRASRSHIEAFEILCDEMSGLYDLNHTYRISQVKSGQLSLACFPSACVCDELHTATPGSREACLTRLGRLNVVGKFAEFGNAVGKQVKCIHEGDRYCEYSFTLQPKMTPFVS
jgi:hypothetical protein